MYQVECLYDYYDKNQAVQPPFTANDLQISDPKRFLTTYEVKQNTRNMTICDMGLMEVTLDINRASKVLTYLMYQYPFFSYGIEFDHKAGWLRYVQQEVQPVELQIVTQFKSLEDLASFIDQASNSLNSNKLVLWELVEIQIPEMPTVVQALSMKVHHTLVDGVSIIALFKKFNEIYEDKSFNFVRPNPVQISNYRPVMSYQNQLVNFTPKVSPLPIQVTQITGQFKDKQFGSNLKVMDELKIRCRHYKEEDLARIQNVQYSFSLYATYLAQFAAYAYFNEDITKDQKFVATAVDLRREVHIQQTDFQTILGQTATANGMLVSGTISTSLQHLADQLQSQFTNQDNSASRFWQRTLAHEVGPVSFNKGPECSVICSNVGKMNLGVGPIVQAIGYTSYTHVWDKPILGFANSIHRGKIGTFVLEWDVQMFTIDQQTAQSLIFVKLNQMIKTKGAENVSVQNVVDLYQELFE
ncbi:Conserved_hypothetical protein [Hexamita inflata]|uniref:Condensation domain-containing protein n=1 Tax=Hexamita inflata TaxID=28002 RepID=A0AA86N3U6_9EUKA|nr:Conserved hypothetical protein [Hexamita inflata]